MSERPISRQISSVIYPHIPSTASKALLCLQCFDAVGWAAGRASGLHTGVVICLERGADLHMAQLMTLPLTVSCCSKIQIGFTFLVLANLGGPGKGPLNVCVCASLRHCHITQEFINI